MLQKQMRCEIKAESLLFPTMYKSQKVTFPTCSGFCGSGSHLCYVFMYFKYYTEIKTMLKVPVPKSLENVGFFCSTDRYGHFYNWLIMQGEKLANLYLIYKQFEKQCLCYLLVYKIHFLRGVFTDCSYKIREILPSHFSLGCHFRVHK